MLRDCGSCAYSDCLWTVVVGHQCPHWKAVPGSIKEPKTYTLVGAYEWSQNGGPSKWTRHSPNCIFHIDLKTFQSVMNDEGYPQVPSDPDTVMISNAVKKCWVPYEEPAKICGTCVGEERIPLAAQSNEIPINGETVYTAKDGIYKWKILCHHNGSGFIAHENGIDNRKVSLMDLWIDCPDCGGDK